MILSCRAATCIVLCCIILSCAEPKEPESPVPSDERSELSGISENTAGSLQTVSDGDLHDPPPGRWHTFRPNNRTPSLTEEQRTAIERLEAIGYLGGSQSAPNVSGVRVHEPAYAHKGLNFYVSGHAPEAVLMDMDGNVLHTWTYDFDKIWPDRRISEKNRGQYHWRRAYLYENGDILAIHESIGLIKLDKNSNLLWEYSGRAHHDLEVLSDGTIYLLTRKARLIPRINKTRPVLEDFVVVLDAGGKEMRKVSVLECMERSEYESLLKNMRKQGDIFHTNTVEILDGRLAEKSPAFEAGNVLISILKTDSIAILDLDAKKAVWARAGGWRWQHQPTVLSNGNMLLFDNMGTPGKSRVIEFDPITGENVWTYAGTADEPFYSKTCGSCQRLPNGNTLITESNNGRAFEVTPDKTIVWEFISPHRAGENNELIATLFEVERLEPDFPLDWLS